MSTRKPSAATQLKNLRIEHAAVQQKTTALQKELDTQKQRHEQTSRTLTEAQAELTQMHVLLDAMPDAIPRKPVDSDSWTPAYPCSTRLAAWLAARSTR
jgi:septal ring factor EnvC (AmiA/AmiB activator)